jgi:predicted transcriptional regulator
MTTISFSVEDDVKKSFDTWAKRAKKSKSDILRDMVRSYQFSEALDEIQRGTEPILKELGIETEEQLYEYLESDETYEDRLRHKRLSGGNKEG